MWAVILTGLIVVMAWFMMWCVTIVFPESNTGLWAKLISLFVTILIIVKFHDVFLRYPFQKTFTARRIINAPIETVWEKVRPRARNKPYNILQSSIRKIGEDIYRYYQASSSDTKKDFFDIKLVHEVPYQVLKMEYADENSPHDMVKTSRGITYSFKSINKNQTEISISEVHDKPSLFTFYIYEFVGANRDDFRQLANACEGQANISWASAQIAMEEIAGHPDATLADVLRPISDGALMAMTALVTAVTMVTVWVI